MNMSFPGRIVQHLYRKMFPSSQYQRSDGMNQYMFNSLTFFYVLITFTGTGLWFMYKKQREAGSQGPDESYVSYMARMRTTRGKIEDENHEITKWTVNLGIGTSADERKTGFQTADITDEVKFNHIKAHYPERLKEDYDPYEDEAYVRRRLKVSENDAKFDMEWASVYLRRLDRKTLFYGDPYIHRLTGQGYEKGNKTQEPTQLK